jgi:hypothetical protein
MMLANILLGPKGHSLLELRVCLMRILKEDGFKCAGEPAAVSEALGAITALAVSGDACLINAVTCERAGPYLTQLSSLYLLKPGRLLLL